MLDLRYALALLGVVIVLGVALSAYDKIRINWKHWFRKPRQDTSPRPKRIVPAQVLDAGLDINPGPPSAAKGRFLRADAAVDAVAEDVQSSLAHDELEDFENAAMMPLNLSLGLEDPDLETGARPASSRFRPDEKIDFIINLPGKKPVSHTKALGIYKQNEYLLDKPRRIFGLRANTGLWSNLDFDPEYQQYTHLSLALQLADTRGPVDETELNKFLQLGLKLAEALGRATKLSITVEQALDRAKALDRFCEANDVLASINIVSRSDSGFTGRAIDLAANRYGLQFGAMNIYHMKNNNPHGCRHLFSLANMYKPGEFELKTLDKLRTKGITLFMSVPTAHNPVRVFEKMAEVANGLCQVLGGVMQDQDGRPLTDDGLRAIRAQINHIAANMQNGGVVPGSETAMRLF